MDFFDLGKLMVRWWLVTLPLLVLTITCAVVLSGRIQPEFTARGSLIMVGPGVSQDAESTDVVNPLLSQNGALPTTAYVTSLAMTSPQVASVLAQEGLSTSYDVAAETRMPIILLETRAESREMATNTALRLVDLIEADLRLRQDAAVVPADERVTIDVISIAVVGGADYGGRTRMRVAVLGLGLMLTVGSAFLADGLRQRRRPTMDDGNEATGESRRAARQAPGKSSHRPEGTAVESRVDTRSEGGRTAPGLRSSGASSHEERRQPDPVSQSGRR